VVGVVLSGTRDDGTVGLRAIRARGGIAIVQHPDEALFPGMPQSAVADDLDAELQWAHPDLAWPAPADPPLGTPSGFTCPECHGGLWEIDDGHLPRYRCRVGHGFSADSLLEHFRADAAEIARQAETLQALLWSRQAQGATESIVTGERRTEEPST
jgi:two-component system chemotaxis response regulator CheB